MSKKRCIIYGGAGFIGSHIADALLENNYDVTVFDKINSSTRNIEHILSYVKFIQGDFNNTIDLRKSLQEHDYAVHLVSSTLPANSNLNPSYDVESNLVSTLHLLDECVKQNLKKIIFISSGGTVYGNPVSVPVKETHPTNPTSSYGIIKLTIEKYFELYRQRFGLNYTILRLANPFGERQNPLLGQGLISSLLYKIKHRKQIEIWGDGNTVRDFFYIKDGTDAFIKTLAYKGKFNLFNIARGKGLSVNQIIDKFKSVLGLKFKVKYSPSREFDVKKNILDITLAGKELGWKPQSDFDKSLEKTWRYIRDNE